MFMEWKSYLRDRVIAKHPKNFYIIKPRDAEAGVPLSCPVCDTLMRSRDDENAWHDFSCCHMCSMAWAAPRRKEWKEGWRPSEQDLLAEVKRRPPHTVQFYID